MKSLFISALVAMTIMPNTIKASENDNEIALGENLETAETNDNETIATSEDDDDTSFSLLNGKYKLSFTIGSSTKSNNARRHYHNNIPTLYFGYTTLAPTGTIGTSDALSQKSTSYEWGMYPFSWDASFNKRGTFGMSLNLGFSRSSYRFRDGNAILKDAEGNLNFAKFTDSDDVQKSWLRFWSIKMPIMFGFRPEGTKLNISAGPELEWRLGALSRVKYDNRKHTVVDDPNINALGVNLLVSLSYRDFCVLGRLGLTDLMNIKSSSVQQGQDFKVAPVMIGIGFGL